MERTMGTISACLVVYNEEKIIGRCLESIVPLVDEIIIVHDGECKDKTLDIAKKYTDKIFVKPHVGIAEPLRSFSYEQATSEWILQIDADEYIDPESVETIKALAQQDEFDGFNFKWELFDGKNPVHNDGFLKLCLFRRNKITYQGIPQTAVTVNGRIERTDIFLRHRPAYSNISWKTANSKRNYWLKSHVPYFFPELVEYHCFNTTIDPWIAYTKRIRKHPLFYMAWHPLKNFLGQMKNGLWKTWIGVNIALQQYIYYLMLYWKIWQMDRKLMSRS